MAATALLRFTQGAHVGNPGEALLGELTTMVHLLNATTTDIVCWRVDLVYVDPTSALSVPSYTTYYGNGAVAVDFIPDVRGSYRWMLQVWEVAGWVGDPADVDIRVFSVPEDNGMVVPPAQIWPLPLPDPRTGALTAKPNELNFNGQDLGWSGNGSSDGLMSNLVRLADSALPRPFRGVTTTGGIFELARFDSNLWSNNIYVRVGVEVIVDNDTGTNGGYFDRVTIFRKGTAGTLVQRIGGEVVHATAPAYGGPLGPISTFHSLFVYADASRYVVIACSPVGATPAELDLVWTGFAQFSFSKR